jgi:hypothetical protein
LAEATLLRERAAFAIQSADRRAHARCFNIQIQPRTLEQIKAADLRFSEIHAMSHDTAIAMHDNQRRLIHALRVRAGASYTGQKQKQYKQQRILSGPRH